MSISNGRIMSRGLDSPILYTNGNIIFLDKVNATAFNSQAIVNENGNVSVTNSFIRANRTGVNNDNGLTVMFSKTGNESFLKTENTNYQIIGKNETPIFYITNTIALINIKQCIFVEQTSTFLNVSGNNNGWGTRGNNGGTVELNLVDQDIVGDTVIDSSSYLATNMKNSTTKGKINNAKTAASLEINLDADSSIELTGNSYYTELNNDDSIGSNINKNSFTF